MNASERVETILADLVGLDAASLGRPLVERAVGRRLKALGASDREDYARRLARDAAEQQELIEELVVPETWFFRDERAFAALRSFALGWSRAPDRPPLRALSIACATGEEAYSIALTLRDAGLEADRHRIVAVDLSERCLSAARRGVYSARSVRRVGDDLARRAFRPAGDGLEVLPAARAQVEFRRANLFDPAFLAAEPPFDVVFCRNLLIYLHEHARRLAVEHIRRLLKPDGLLFLGPADHCPDLSSRFAPRGHGGFVYGLRGPSNDVRPAAEPPRRAPRKAVAPRKTVPVRPPTPRPPEPPAPSLLERAAALADRREYHEAAEACRQAIRRHGPHAEAFHLLGVIAQAQGQDRQAEEWLNKAVFLDNRHEEALLALALLAGKRGDRDAAIRCRRRARRAREAKEGA